MQQEMQYDTIVLLGLINRVAVVVHENVEFWAAARADVVQGSCQDLVYNLALAAAHVAVGQEIAAVLCLAAGECCVGANAEVAESLSCISRMATEKRGGRTKSATLQPSTASQN